MSNIEEQTYIMIKPDGVQRGLVGEIIKRFEQRGYHLSALKLTQVNWILIVNDDEKKMFNNWLIF